MNNKPKMPENRPKIQTKPMEAELDLDLERYSSGGLRMNISDMTVDIYDSSKNKVGTVQAPIGGGVSVVVGSRHWYIKPVAIFESVKEADDEYVRKRDMVPDISGTFNPTTSSIFDALSHFRQRCLDMSNPPDAAQVDTHEKLFDAMHAFVKLTLLFHSGSPWDERKHGEWMDLQAAVLKLPSANRPYRRYATSEVTTKVLCDLGRIILG